MSGLIARLDHQFINDLEPFTTVNPSAENLAKYFFDNLTSQLTGLPPVAKLKNVVIWETDTAMARYHPERVEPSREGQETGAAKNGSLLIILIHALLVA